MSDVLLSCMYVYIAHILLFCASVLVSSCHLVPHHHHQHTRKQKTNILFPQPRVESGPGLRTNPSIANVIKSIVIYTNAFSLLQPAAMDTCRKVCVKWSHIYYLPTSQYLLNVGVLASARKVYIISFLVTSI